MGHLGSGNPAEYFRVRHFDLPFNVPPGETIRVYRSGSAYGASNARIIFRYMVPKVIPVLIPQFVAQVPNYVFLEATLAVLGLGDPVLPTWGKLLNDAYTSGALFNGHYYWVLEPAFLLVVTGLGFAMLGFALTESSTHV